MAGLGNRFSEQGYLLPKPLIPVSGMPMVLKAARDMPSADRWIFVVRKEHVKDYGIDRLLKKDIRGATVISVDKTTEGTACTCLLARNLIKEEDSLFIGACDVGYLYDKNKYASLLKDKAVDCIFWTFTQREMLREKPASYGWYKTEDDGRTIKEVSVKKPISKDPYRDHAVVSSFYFRRAGDFFSGIDLMIRKNHRINNEYYLDALPVYMKELGKRSVIFDVDLFVCWGDPKSVYEYQRAEYMCMNNATPKNNATEEANIISLWKKYFEVT